MPHVRQSRDMILEVPASRFKGHVYWASGDQRTIDHWHSNGISDIVLICMPINTFMEPSTSIVT